MSRGQLLVKLPRDMDLKWVDRDVFIDDMVRDYCWAKSLIWSEDYKLSSLHLAGILPPKQII